MDFKISKESEENLKKMLQEEEDSRQLHSKKLEEEKAFQEKYGFKTEEELIDWVLSGKVAVSRYDWLERIYREGDLIKIRVMDFSDCDVPLGYFTKTKTIEEFKTWRNGLSKFQEEGFEISWIKLP